MSFVSGTFSRPARFALVGLAVAVAALTAPLALGGAPGGAAPTCTMNFTATAGGSFFTPGNWDVNRLPTTTDYACIPVAVTGAVTYAGNVTVAGVDVEGTGGFAASSGTLTLTDVVNASAIKKLTLSGATIAGAANVTLKGTTAWSSGTMTGTGTTTLSAGVTMTVTGRNSQPDATLNRAFMNHGTILVPATDGLVLNFAAAVLTNAVDGIVNLNGDGASLYWWNSPGSIVNNGLITRSLGAGTAFITVPVTNKTSGVIDLGPGTLAMSRGLTNSGQVNVGFQTLNVTGGMTSTGKGILEIAVGPSSHGNVTVATTNVLAGELHIDLQSGYTPAVGTAVQLITTTGTQSGAFKAGAYQMIGATNTGWKFATSANKVVATVRPLSDVSAGISAPATTLTQTIPFNVDVKVTNNGPIAANNAAVTLTLPASVHVSGALPAGCTQPTAATVRCAAGTVAVSATTTFTISLVANAAATDTLTVAASTANTDIVATNNKQSASVTVV